MRVSVLMENTAAREGFLTEHGLSLFLEGNGRRVLFDMGASGGFADNARRLGVPLDRVDFAVLSHGHYDHGGGLARFFQENAAAPVYANEHAFEQYRSGSGRDIGVPRPRQAHRVVPVGDDRELGYGFSLHTGNRLPREFETDAFGLCAVRAGAVVTDDFCHEQYLVVEQDGRRLVFSGCSHKGVFNILRWFQPDVFVGGFHFMEIDPAQGVQRLDEAARLLLEFPTVYYTCHCTGLAQYDRLRERMGERLHYLAAGDEIAV
ncbi:MBL fold metallo-hydrolase [Feifania hominis]|uniref:MBL fold metallo-hydrolase n=1 Tax=Feifania hominis TaxID=2763660 RepID=A0A926DGL8_9FIRM|nr:MBL fold metallo-hydrolase [Feifania hominis]MBC8536685.1 MBL fold metallo-hydrolase [Feifania hominis]